MKFIDHQLAVEKNAFYPGASEPASIDGLSYVTLGLVGEAGELANKVKKILRDDHGEITNEHRKALSKELGDVLWYTAQFATQLGMDLGWIAEDNLKKLADRRERGVLQGSGDDR
jgi:NTP pyrophosphatase (non-canonical NTP hydrolase)